MTDIKKPKPSTSLAQQELDNAEKQFKAFDENVKELTLDRMNQAPKQEIEAQTKLSQDEIAKSKEIYLKPNRTIRSAEKFNEDYRKDYEFAKEYVNFIAENKEIIGEDIEMWTKPFAGLPAEEWKVPTNRPVWGPRYLAEAIKSRTYHRLQMKENIPTQNSGAGQFYGHMVSDTIIQRLDALPVSRRKSIFMGAGAGF